MADSVTPEHMYAADLERSRQDGYQAGYMDGREAVQDELELADLAVRMVALKALADKVASDLSEMLTMGRL